MERDTNVLQTVAYLVIGDKPSSLSLHLNVSQKVLKINYWSWIP